MVCDDIGAEVRQLESVARVVSLVPCLTETIASVAPERRVGATQWCTHPPHLAVRRVGGTKNRDVAAIVELRPDLVVANREENRRLDVDGLVSAGIPVWVTDIKTLAGAFSSLRRLFAWRCAWPCFRDSSAPSGARLVGQRRLVRPRAGSRSRLAQSCRRPRRTPGCAPHPARPTCAPSIRRTRRAHPGRS